MKSKTLFMRIKDEGKSFFAEVSKANEMIYLILFTLYVAIYIMMKVAWVPDIDPMMDNIRYAVLSVVMWGSALYLFFIIAGWKNLWKKNVPLILVGIVILVSTFLFSRKMSTNSYGVVMDAFFCLLVYGKDYKKMLRSTLIVTVIFLIIAAIGLPAGYTMDLMKPYNVSPGHSIGIEYPNSWGYLAFLAAIIIWYLYLRFKPIFAFVLFWGLSAFLYLYVSCRTLAGVTIVFPIFALIADVIEKKADKRVTDKQQNTESKRNKQKQSILKWIIITIPVICFFIMLFMSLPVEWMHKHFYYTAWHNFAMRFVIGGLYFRTYGFPIVGNPYRKNVQTYVNVNDDYVKVGILDSSYAAYIIMRGLLWMAYTLAWLCLAHWKALKKRDYGIIFLSTVILLFAMMERPGLDLWFNFILLYPLAKVISKPGAENVLEFATVHKASEVDFATGESVVMIEKASIVSGAQEMSDLIGADHNNGNACSSDLASNEFEKGAEE